MANTTPRSSWGICSVAMSAKTGAGRFFEDFAVGQTIVHAVPRTVSGGERALYHALYPARHAVYSSDVFARQVGLPASPIDDMIVFHLVLGKTVPDISLNAIANLGYAGMRWLRPVWPGDTLRATSTVIGLKQNSNGQSGVVYVRTTGLNQQDQPVLDYVRWAMVRKRDPDAPAPETVVPVLAAAVGADRLIIPPGLDFTAYDFAMAGEPHRWGDYAVGERIDHVDGVTVEEAEHMMATRLWQNTARVHFDATVRPDGRRLVYGGHVMSLARALSFNAGAHANPCFAGDTVRAWSEVLDLAKTGAPGVGAVRLRTVAVKSGAAPFALREAGGGYDPMVLLDMDYWALMPV
jgi:2-methylfumaryl-CoA hydratase